MKVKLIVLIVLLYTVFFVGCIDKSSNETEIINYSLGYVEYHNAGISFSGNILVGPNTTESEVINLLKSLNNNEFKGYNSVTVLVFINEEWSQYPWSGDATNGYVARLNKYVCSTSAKNGIITILDPDDIIPATRPTPAPTTIPISDQAVAKYDYKWHTTKYIGDYSKAPLGYTYAVFTYRIKNDGYNTIYTSPVYWEFSANGITYTYDSVSHSDEINTISVEVNNGGDVTNKIVFLIPNNIDGGAFYYDSWYGDSTIYRDNSLLDN